MSERSYTVGELRKLIRESANEFKPVMYGQEENKTNNKKTYKDAEKQAKDYDGGLQGKSPKAIGISKDDDNKTTLDVNTEYDLDDKAKDRIKAQSEGYTSTLEKDNKIEKDPSLEFSDKTYKRLKDKNKEDEKVKEIAKSTGLVSSKVKEKNPNAFKKNTVYKENKISVLNFKKTTFLNEEHMISRIPDEYKVEGKKFKMNDNSGNSFLVEWKENEANILHFENKKKLNESMNRIQQLFNYKPSDYVKNSTGKSRIDESNEFSYIMEKVRKISDNE